MYRVQVEDGDPYSLCDGARMTYQTRDGIAQDVSSFDDWYYGFEARDRQYVAISAQSHCDSYAEVTVSIYVNGKLERRVTSQGRYVIASANAFSY